MLNALLKLLTAALIAAGIVGFVTGWDFAQVPQAANAAYEQAMARKSAHVTAKAQSDQPKQESEDSRISVVVRQVDPERIVSQIRMTGETEASRRVDVRAETSGIVAIAARRGERVRAGDLLCRLEIGDRQVRREAAVARMNQALTEERAQRRLSEKGFAAANNASAKAAEAAVIRSEIQQIDIDIRRLEILAPYDAIVETAPVEVGALLQVGGTCASLIDLDPLRVSGFVPESRIGALTLGSQATARLATGERVTGSIAFVASAADASTRTFEIEVEVPNPAYRLRDGVTAEIEIPTEQQVAHRIPQSALTLNDDGALGVMVEESGVARFRPVRIVRDGTNGAWVQGLDAQVRVIVVGQEFVSDGSAIRSTPQTGDILGDGA